MSIYGKGTSPRKQMAMGAMGSDFGVSAYPGSNAKAHPDRGMAPGTMMDEANRGVGAPIAHTAGQLPAQSAPRHGPHHERALGFMRGPRA